MNRLPYYSLNEYCLDTFGEKLYRLSLDAGFSCPNRDGTLSTGGCIFCSEGGSGDFAAHPVQEMTGRVNDTGGTQEGPAAGTSVHAQIEAAKARIAGKADCRHFIAYFQAYTNTYAPAETLRDIFTRAAQREDIAVVSIATRPDCLGPEVMEVLDEVAKIKPVWIELGLQTCHQRTMDRLNSHLRREQFEAAAELLAAHGIPMILHLILGLPGESREDMLQSVRYAVSLGARGVKLQLLHYLKGTQLGRAYEADPEAFEVMDLETYADLICDCISIIPSETVIHRFTGDGPKRILLAPLWSGDKKRVLNTITKRLKERGIRQGNGT